MESGRGTFCADAQIFLAISRARQATRVQRHERDGEVRRRRRTHTAAAVSAAVSALLLRRRSLAVECMYRRWADKY